ncbi:MAG: alpha/beta hydrolase family esterase [Chloroflexota bacterium]
MNRKFPHLLLAGCALLIATLACTRLTNRARGLPVDSVRELTHEGRVRDYHVHIPASLDLTQPVPLVMVFHGGGGKAENAIRTTNFDEVADEEGFIVVYPNGTGPREVEVYTWNAGDCCANAMLENADDVGFARAILADVQTIATIDLKRVYAAGMSNGGMMSYRLACEAADMFAAVAPVAGAVTFAPCNPSEPVSVIHFHGTADEHVPYEGGIGPNAVYPAEYVSVQESVGFWITFDGCDSQPATSQMDKIQHTVWAGCERGSSVELYSISGGGHVWPGSGRDEGPGQSLLATWLIWEFFKEHPKP